MCILHSDLGMQTFNENFANYFFKTNAKNKCFRVLKCKCVELQKSYSYDVRYLKIVENFSIAVSI